MDDDSLGIFFVLRKAAQYQGIPYCSLHNGLKNNDGEDFHGVGGRSSNILPPEEDQLIVDHVK